MIKVNVVIPSFYPAVRYGGPIFSSYHTCTELAKIDDIEIFVSTTNANVNSRLPVDTDKWTKTNGFQVKYYNETVIGKFSRRLFFNIWKDIKSADIVHVQSIFNTPTPIALLASKVLKKKVLLSTRGQLGSWCLDSKKFFKKLWMKCIILPFLKNAVFHATSNQEKEEILAVFPKADVIVIPNGIEYERFLNSKTISRKAYLKKYLSLNSSAEKIVISMGRIHQKKGFDILVKSFAQVLDTYPSAKLLIAGEDEGEVPILLKLVQDLKLTNSIFFIGSISGQDKIDFFANADLFVLPSHNENFGNVYIESLAAGTPIVASLNTPWSEVEEVNCGKWTENSVSKTTTAILEMLHLDRDTLRNNSQNFAKNYGWNSVANEFALFYRAFK
jgi:glycosyltransferase involved in cell wall biosynthesis